MTFDRYVDRLNKLHKRSEKIGKEVAAIVGELNLGSLTDGDLFYLRDNVLEGYTRFRIHAEIDRREKMSDQEKADRNLIPDKEAKS